MPTREVIALLTDSPENHLHELYIHGALSILEAYLSSGFSFLAIDPDRREGFRLPDNVSASVDVIFITLKDFEKKYTNKSLSELKVFKNNGSVFFIGDLPKINAIDAMKSCDTFREYGVAQTIIPPVANVIMNKVYPEQAQHLPLREIADQYRDAVENEWENLRKDAGMTDIRLDPLFKHIELAWREGLPVIIAEDAQDYIIASSGMMWTGSLL